MKQFHGSVLGAAVVTTVLGAAPLSAADEPAAAGDDVLEEVVVTGTLVRGVAPVGSLVKTVSQAEIEQLGASNTNQLITSIPQFATSFNLLANVPTAAQGRTTIRPSLRGLPSGNANGTTLFLVDGHNIVGAAMQQNNPDIGAIPLGAIERVEVVLDGGSAIYGSDAVAGTVNFITRTHFEGIEVSADYGGAGANHRAWNLNLTAGHDWEALLNFMWVMRSHAGSAT